MDMNFIDYETVTCYKKGGSHIIEYDQIDRKGGLVQQWVYDVKTVFNDLKGIDEVLMKAIGSKGRVFRV